MKRRPTPLVLLFPPLVLGGCATAPSLNMLGAFFPSWLFCVAGGAVAALAVRAAVRRKGLQIGPPLAVYPVLTVLFSLLCWVFFFQN